MAISAITIYEGPAVNLDERVRIVESLGPHDALILRSHGLLTCGPNILQRTAELYQPGTRRPCGVLEWPAMLRFLDAEEEKSGYPSYKT